MASEKNPNLFVQQVSDQIYSLAKNNNNDDDAAVQFYKSIVGEDSYNKQRESILSQRQRIKDLIRNCTTSYNTTPYIQIYEIMTPYKIMEENLKWLKHAGFKCYTSRDGIKGTSITTITWIKYV